MPRQRYADFNKYPAGQGFEQHTQPPVCRHISRQQAKQHNRRSKQQLSAKLHRPRVAHSDCSRKKFCQHIAGQEPQRIDALQRKQFPHAPQHRHRLACDHIQQTIKKCKRRTKYQIGYANLNHSSPYKRCNLMRSHVPGVLFFQKDAADDEENGHMERKYPCAHPVCTTHRMGKNHQQDGKSLGVIQILIAQSVLLQSNSFSSISVTFSTLYCAGQAVLRLIFSYSS